MIHTRLLLFPLIFGLIGWAFCVWSPKPGTTWQWQISGKVNLSHPVEMFDIDLFDAVQSDIDALHTQGKIVICYVDVGTWENWRPDAASFPESVKGKSNGWPGEKWLDIRQIDILGPILEARFALAVSKKCDGVEPDNVDGYTNPTGFPLTAQDQIKFNTWYAALAHNKSLSVGLKNDVDQAKDLVNHFDWALDEQCFQYSECDTLLPFIQANKAVFECEYDLAVTSFCDKADQMKFSSIRKHLELDDWVQVCWK